MHCGKCGEIVITPPSNEYPPGSRWLCHQCATRRVNSAALLAELYEEVSHFIQDRMGVDISLWLPPEAVLVKSANTLVPREQRILLGKAKYTENHIPILGRRWISNVEVYILRELDYLQAGSVLAHEMFHVYSAANGLNLDHVTEEGTANLWGYLFLRHHPGIESDRHREELLKSMDPVYGAGFRKARDNYKKCTGFQEYLSLL